MPNYTILVIDYEPRSIASTVEPLRTAGYHVEVASDGITGLKTFHELQPGLVLIEAMIPKKHGFDVCQEIKKSPDGKCVPVVITTAVYKGRKYRSQAKHIYGCDEYLEKPFGADRLLEICNGLIGEPPAAAQAAERQVVNAAPVVSSAAIPQPPVPQPVAVSPMSAPEPQAPVVSTQPPPATAAEQEIADCLDAALNFGGLDFGEDEPEPPAKKKIATEPAEPEPIEAETEETGESQVESGPALDDPERSVEAREDSAEQSIADALDSLLDEQDDVTPTEHASVLESDEEIDSLSADIDRAIDAIAAPYEDGDPDPAGDDEEAGALEAEAEPEAEPEPSNETPEPARLDAAADAGDPWPSTDDAVAEKKSRAGLWLGLAALVVIGAGVGVFFALSGDSAQPPATIEPTTPAPSSTTIDPRRPHTGLLETDSLDATAGLAAAALDGPVSVAGNPAPAAASPPETPVTTPKPKADVEVKVARPVPAAERVATREETPEQTQPKRPQSAAPKPEVASTVDALAARPAQPYLSPSESASSTADPLVTSVDALAARVEDTMAAPAPEPEIQRPAPRTMANEPVARPEPATPEPPQPGALMHITEVDDAPRSLERGLPTYPDTARRLRQEGDIVLKLLIGENGAVEDVELVQGIANSQLNNTAIKAVQRWKYSPATKMGVPVKVWKTEKLVFRL